MHSSAGCTGSIAASASGEASDNFQSRLRKAKGGAREVSRMVEAEEREAGGRRCILLNDQISREFTHYHNSIKKMRNLPHDSITSHWVPPTIMGATIQDENG